MGAADSGTHRRLSASSIANGAVVTALSARLGPASSSDQIGLALYTDSSGNRARW
jgi:hypothetical protein